MARKNNGPGLRLGEPLPPHHLANLINRQKAYSDFIRGLELEYPDPNDPQISFSTDITDSLFGGLHPALFGTDYDYFHSRRNRRNRGNQRGRGRQSGGGRGKGGGRKPQYPDPKVVYAEIAKMFQGKPLAGMTGNIILFETNLEFWQLSKAKYFEDAANVIVPRCHIMFCEEVAKDGLEHTAKVAGYTAYVSPENTRHQAVGFLVHPRIKVVGDPIEYDSLANVQGIPDLRPGWRLDCEDTITGERFSVVVLHLKSMRGGPKVTSVVRYKQLQLLAQDLGPEFEGIVAGDMNFPLNDPNFQDADPLYKAGFRLIAAGDTQGTQIIGSRIDGYFVKGMKVGVDYYRVFAYFRNPLLGRSFTDHATCEVELLVSSKASTGDIVTTGDAGGDSDTDVSSQLIGGFDLPPVVLKRYGRRQDRRRR